MPDPFYQSKQWKRLRARHLKRFPYCAVADCGKRASFVDHVETVRDAPHRRLDPFNLQSLCAFHHGALTAAYDRGSIAGACDENGFPLDPNHPWSKPDNAAAIAAVNTAPQPDSRLTSRLKRRHAGKGR